MHFNLIFYLQLVIRSFFPGKEKAMRLTWWRLRSLAIFYFVFPFCIITGWIGLLLDEIFYRGYKKVKVKKPLFIIGNFRSGSTLLQRVLARDHHHFTSLRTWEIYLAPSVSQRKFIFALMKVDKLFGSPVFKKLQEINKANFSGIQMHKVSLYEPEEDEALFLYLFASLFIWFFYPVKNLEKAFAHFDHSFPLCKRRKMMSFYKSCVQRHLYFHTQKEAIFMSKNPAFTPKVASILELFPDARFILLVRTPHQLLSSVMNWFKFAWTTMADPADEKLFLSDVVELTRHWYLYPLKALRALPKNQWELYNYHRFVTCPWIYIRRLYKKYGFKISASFQKILYELENKIAQYKSPHLHSSEDFGIPPDKIEEIYKDVFRVFPFLRNV
ncbi:MAG: sulfotransferase [Spirochaetales bacterium]|nr:sulfotransferase [Spirochaetales bacterium]